MGGHAEDRADGDDSRAADASDQDRVWAIEDVAPLGLGDIRRRRQAAHGFARTRAFDRDERRAEAVDAGKILVAARLIDDALAAEFGLLGLDRDAIGFDAAIAATFANRFVDEGALVGIGIFAALAPPALFRRAGLIVDQHRRARNLAQFLLDLDQFFARPDCDPRRPPNV